MKKKVFRERRNFTKDPIAKEIKIEALEYDKETGKVKPKKEKKAKK